MSSQASSSSDAIRQGVPRMPSYSSAASRDGDDTRKLPKRANTAPNSSSSKSNQEAVVEGDEREAPSAFESGAHSDNDENADTARGSVELDELPIELITLTDRYACGCRVSTNGQESDAILNLVSPASSNPSALKCTPRPRASKGCPVCSKISIHWLLLM